MNEKVVTIIIGVIVGLILMAAIIFGPKIMERLPQKRAVSPVTNISVTPTPQINKTDIIVDKPIDNQIVSTTQIQIAGKAWSKANLVVYSPADEQKITADDNGQFSLNIKIEDGQNKIIVAALDQNGKLISVTKQVFLEIAQ